MADQPFDIHQLDQLEYDDAEPILPAYQEALIRQFADSPEGQAYLETDPEMGGWIDNLIYFAYCYEGFTLPKMTKANIQLVLEELFPRKISLFAPEEADTAIPELIAFWQFLKREYQFKHADAILKYLRQLQPKYRQIMNDSSRFGMAKTFFSMGQQAGFDMTTQEGLQEFVQLFNAQIAPKLSVPRGFGAGLSSTNPLGQSASKQPKSTEATAKSGSKTTKSSRSSKRSNSKTDTSTADTGVFGQHPPRFDFFLNPYTDIRFTTCPKCSAKTKLRKLPLFIHIYPSQPVSLNKTCRYCPNCDLLIVHKNELDALLGEMTGQPNFNQSGEDYLVVGTIDRKDWQEGMPMKTIEELRAIVHDFKRVLEFKLAPYGWMKDK